MATARTKIDALGYYVSDPAGLGGVRGDLEINPLDCFVRDPIGPVIIQHVTPSNGTGTGTIRAASTSTLAYKAPGDTEGSAVTVSANTSVLLESGTASKAVRVYRDSVYNAGAMGGTMSLDLYRQYNNDIAGDNTDENGGNYYTCIYIANHSGASVTSITVTPAVLGTQRTSNSTQLGASGAGTITTTGSLADWPDYGWCHVRTSGGSTRELVYYTSRTSTVLTVPAAGRALLGTTAAAGASDDTITPVAPIRVWAETPTSGEVQTIANHTTAPTSPTWSFSDAIGTLADGEERALWIHRHVPAGATVNTQQLSGITVAFTSGSAYSQTLYGLFRISDSTLEGYELYIGEDTAPDFTAAADATSTTLPFSHALSTSTTSYYAVRYRNAYNLTSFNTLTGYTTTGALGEDETATLTPPTVVSIDSVAGGEIDIILRYNPTADATAADTWRLYITTDGSTPDPGVDTPSDTTMNVTALAGPTLNQLITIGPYDYGTVVKFIPRVYSTTLDDESANVAVTTETVDTQAPVMANWLGLTTGGYYGHRRRGYDSTTYYNSPTNTVGIQILTGETVLFGASEALRGVLGNGNELRTVIDFANVAHSDTGTAAPIEVVDSNTFYICVNGTRRAKIDLSIPRIEAATFEFEETPISLPVIGPTHADSTATYIQIFNGVTGRWTPIVKVDSNGVFTATAPVNQE